MMQQLRDDLSSFEGESVLTIGSFDGIHLGHQTLIETIKERARALNARSGMVTFDPHPAMLVRPQQAPQLLTSLEEKIDLLEEQGLDLLVLLTFNRTLMETRASNFLAHLATHLHPRELWVGPDFAMGYKREGNVDFMRRWAEPRGIQVFTIPTVEIDGEPVRSSRIRALIREGKVEESSRLLGRPPSVSGIVQAGEQRGRTIGFPTANLVPEPFHILPANGVYATLARLPDGEIVPGVTNVGTRPTFDGQQRQVESHLFDWSGDLYGKLVKVHFLHRLREERKFPNVQALLAQIQADAAEARTLLTSRSEADPKQD